MKNITITMDEEVARWARVEAARREMSVSRFLGALAREKMDAGAAYERARRSFMAIEPTGHSGGHMPTRDEIHDRAALRR